MCTQCVTHLVLEAAERGAAEADEGGDVGGAAVLELREHDGLELGQHLQVV